ncbi:MAG: DNA polymerase III subunit delta [Bacteroidales bacterium]|nr:DNA polymerase III subunit delta [Bacteroidales bacterium]
MAKKSESSTGFTTLMSEVRAGRFAPVYLLHGEESYFIDRLAEALQQRVVSDEAARDFDSVVMYGQDSNMAEVAGAVRRFPVMSDRQLVMLKELQTMNDGRNQLTKLAPLVQNPSASTVLVITLKGEPLKPSHAFVKALEKGGGVNFRSDRLRDWELNAFITDLCAEHRVRIDRTCVELLKDSVGGDLSVLSQQVRKLIVAAGGEPITPELIEEHIGISKDYNNFELIKAMSLRDYAKAMTIVDYFQRNPKTNPVLGSLPLLFRYFSQLMLAHYAPDKSERGLMAQLGFHNPYQLTDVKPGLQRYTAGSVLRIIHALRMLDAHVKGIDSMQNEYALLRQFIYEAFTL